MCVIVLLGQIYNSKDKKFRKKGIRVAMSNSESKRTQNEHRGRVGAREDLTRATEAPNTCCCRICHSKNDEEETNSKCKKQPLCRYPLFLASSLGFVRRFHASARRKGIVNIMNIKRIIHFFPQPTLQPTASHMPLASPNLYRTMQHRHRRPSCPDWETRRSEVLLLPSPCASSRSYCSRPNSPQ